MTAADPHPTPAETIRLVASLIGHETSHAFLKHHIKFDEFNSPRLGAPVGIHNSEDLVRHTEKVLLDPATRIINTRGRTVYAYHEDTETIVVLTSYSPRSRDGGTVYRRWPDNRGSSSWFSRLVAFDMEKMGVKSFPEQDGGLLRLLQENPALQQDIHDTYERLFKEREFQIARAEVTSFLSKAPGPAVQPKAPAVSLSA